MRRLALPLVLTVLCAAGADGGPPRLALKQCSLSGGIEALCGRFEVPENRSTTDGRTISLRVVVLPSRGATRRPDPIVHITGGPGGSAVADAAGLLSIFDGANRSRDIVLVDQRGTGSSNRLECPLPRKPVATERAVRAYVKACLAGLDADPTQYTTVHAMDDLAEVLHVLGYDKVNLYGVSYGATAAQYFLAQHPDVVRAAILDGATLLDVPIFERLAPNGERALRAVLARCARSRRCASAYPRVRHEVFEVIAALRRKPVNVQNTRIDAATAAGAIHSLTLSPAGAAEIPAIAHSARRNDWVPLALAIDRAGSGANASRQVMFLAIVCNEPWARWRPARVAAASAGTYLAERSTINARLIAAACSVAPTVRQPAWSSARIHSDAPVLFVVGGNDPQDPLAHVAGARRQLPNSRIVVLPAAGHTAVQLGCMPRVAQQFIERGNATRLDIGCLTRYRPPPFVIG